MNCIVCKSDLVSVYKILDSKKYWDCKFCSARFLDKGHHLDPALERERYLLHENRIEDNASPSAQQMDTRCVCVCVCDQSMRR